MEFAGKHLLLIVENNTVPFDRRVWKQANCLRDNGAAVTVICPGNAGDPVCEMMNGIAVYKYRPFFSGGGKAGFIFEFTAAFCLIFVLLHVVMLQRGRIHAVHVANPPDIFWPLALYCRVFSIKFIFDQHDLSPETYLSKYPDDGNRQGFVFRLLRLFEYLSCRFADTIIVTNNSYMNRDLRRMPFARDKICVVRNGPDAEQFRPRPPNPALKKGRTVMYAYIGIMGRQDGVDYVLQAVRHLMEHLNFKDFIVYLIGSGDDFARLTALGRELAIQEHVLFTGRIPDEQALEILTTADVCLSPDPYNPLNDVSTMTKVMEYMAMEKPIVSFYLTENAESAKDAAVYVENNNPAAFAQGMFELAHNPGQARQKGLAGRRRVAEHLSWQKQAQHLVGAYRQCLKLSPVDSGAVSFAAAGTARPPEAPPADL